MSLPVVHAAEPTIDRRVRAWRTLIETLQADPWIARRNPLWRLPDDPNDDDAPPPERLWIRVTPRTLPLERAASGGGAGRVRLWANSPVEVQFEIRFPTAGWEPYLLLWNEIETALGAGLDAPGRSARDDQLRSGGIGQWTATQPPGDIPRDTRIGVGLIRLEVMVPA